MLGQNWHNWIVPHLNGKLRLEKSGGHGFATQLVEAFPGEIISISVSKPTLEDVFIRRTGHRFWSESQSQDAASAKQAVQSKQKNRR